MREVAVVVVANLYIRRVPGDREADIIGDLKKGERFDVLDRKSGPRCEWLRSRAGWVAEFNKITGERFCNVAKIAPKQPKPEPKPVPDFPHLPRLDPEPLLRKDEWPWFIGAIAVCGGVVAAIYFL
jgi:hypothetical protein